MRLFCLVILFVGVSNLGAQPLPKKFAAIQAGTSKADVIKQVGEPLKIEKFATVKNYTHDTSYYWQYANGITIIFTNHAVDVIEPKWENVLKRIQQFANRKDESGIKIINSE